MHRVCCTDSSLNIINHEDWHDWAKNLGDNGGVILILDLNHGKLNEILRLVHFSTNQYLASSFIKHFLNPLEVSLVDYPGEILASLLTVRKEFLQGYLQLFDECWENFLLYHN